VPVNIVCPLVPLSPTFQVQAGKKLEIFEAFCRQKHWTRKFCWSALLEITICVALRSSRVPYTVVAVVSVSFESAGAVVCSGGPVGEEFNHKSNPQLTSLAPYETYAFQGKTHNCVAPQNRKRGAGKGDYALAAVRK
jgi:hypothetical protein